MIIEKDISNSIVNENSKTAILIEDCSDDEEKNTGALETITKVSSGLHHASHYPAFGNVSVQDSENVQFGNNTYFNGPVTIKQSIVQTSSGIDNGSYTVTDEDGLNRPNPPVYTEKNIDPKQCEILVWHKIAALVVLTMTAATVCTLVFARRHSNELKIDSYNGLVESSNLSLNGDPFIIAPNHLRIVSRSQWLAQPVERPLDKMAHPIPWVIVAHTATESCHTQSECVLAVRLIQMFHVESRKWYDIGYNFLIGGDGSVYEGRGWDYQGAHTKGYNKYSIGVAFIGTFNTESPPPQQVDACKKLLKLGVDINKLSQDYKLLSHRQLMSTLSPGDTVHNIIREWPHFVNNSTNVSDLLKNIN